MFSSPLVPYTIKGDDVITILLFVSFLVGIVAIARSKDFIVRQFKTLLREPGRAGFVHAETATEIRFQLFLVFQTCLLLGMIVFFHIVSDGIGSPQMEVSHHLLLLKIVVVFIGYFILRTCLQETVNWVYFERSEIRDWQKAQLFLTATEGVVLFPIVLLLCFFSLSFKSALILTIMVVISVKLLAFYRCFAIFFRKKRQSLQIILYFCTLEIMPLLAFYGLLAHFSGKTLT